MKREAFIIKDVDTGQRLAAAWNGLVAEDKAEAQEAQGHRVAVERVTVPASKATPAPIAKRRRNREHRPMRFYDLGGQVVCRNCRDNLLTNAWLVVDGGVDGAEPLRPRSFAALGSRPWAGGDVGDRYVQCDECMEQWGPDA